MQYVYVKMISNCSSFPGKSNLSKIVCCFWHWNDDYKKLFRKSFQNNHS